MAVEVPGVSTREDTIDEIPEVMFTKRGCCCFLPCFRSERSSGDGSPWWQRIGTKEAEERWWSKGWKAVLKVREWSEIIAGPKWKTFIRRFNKNNNRSGPGIGKYGKFQYDPMSYSLNFDEGVGHDGHSDDDLAFRDFSSRYAAIPISAKCSVDLGKDGPNFT